MNIIHEALRLRLMASPGAWRMYSARRSDPKFKSFQEKVFLRDEYRCRFCGFQTNIEQQVINYDGNYSNNTLDNMVTACYFCAQCFFLESVGVGGYGGGSLIYLPEMTQVELNAMCHVLFCSIVNDTGYKNMAQDIYRTLKGRSETIEQVFGQGTSDPALFGYLLIDTQHTEASDMDALCRDIRLLPSRAKFRQQIERWAANAIKEFSGSF